MGIEMYEAPRHPGVESALSRADIAPGVPYVTFVPGDHVVERGVFTSRPDYEEDDSRWTATALVQKTAKMVVEQTVSLYDAGITPDEKGERWASAVTVLDSDF